VSSRAVVTGGASGIGLAVVRRFLARGSAVTVLDADGAALSRLGDEFAQASEDGSLRGVPVDVADAGAVREAMADSGPADRLVTCAGIKGRRVPALETDEASWRRLMDVHLYGTWAACRAFAELRPPDAGEGAIVTISSIVAASGFTLMLDYGTAKAAIEYITRVLAVEWAPLGIRVNAVAPGYTATPMVGAMQAEGFDLGPVEARTPMGRLAQPDETARVVEFLCYEAGFVTGTVVRVDGGWTAVGR
jgi:NAD(P)-dependent dehydrogenase (short-subunit alcohol dehydrogenase family)